MKTHLECIPCFIKQSLEAARMATDDVIVHEKILKEVMQHLQSVSFEDSPPQLSREVHAIIRSKSKTDDPYKQVKDESNTMAKNLYPHLKSLVERSDDPLLMAIKLSIIGNVIDFGTTTRFDVKDMIDKAMTDEFNDEAYDAFKKRLASSTTILYLADNTGEIFFDKLLIEEIKKMHKDITFVVKTNPIINDALRDDAVFAHIDKYATLLEGDFGQSKSTPGILLQYASTEFLQKFTDADMVISKGQGNYESLNDSKREIFFLLMVKCPLVADDMDRTVGEMVFKVNTV